MDVNCQKCGTVMKKTHGRMHTKYECPNCGHIVREFAGAKKLHAIRLYPFQKHIADKRGGVQYVIDNVLDEGEDDE